QSLKVLSKCPAIARSILESYPRTMPQGMALLPLIKSVLSYQARAQEQVHSDAAGKVTIFTGVSPDVENRMAYNDLIHTQVKTMSLLAHLLRKHSMIDVQQLDEIGRWLPNIVVRLLQDCPSSGREELFTALRSLINFTFPYVFIPIVEELLDGRTLVGHDLTAVQTLKPLAYSMLAELIHRVHNKLRPSTIFMVVKVYTKALQD
ncbi:hypothetical protein GE09DRAFT_920620, partial [Coniochaeta sp. 2T2.1]